MDEGYQWLKDVADRMNRDVDKGAAAKPERLTVRKLLKRFGYERRGEAINNHIRNGLEEFKLRTDQDFTIAWIDSKITIELDSATPDASRAPRTTDPTLRVRMLRTVIDIDLPTSAGPSPSVAARHALHAAR